MKRTQRAGGLRAARALVACIALLEPISCSGRKPEEPATPGPAAFIIEVGESFSLVAPPPAAAGPPAPGYVWKLRRRHDSAVVRCEPDGSVRLPAAPAVPPALTEAKTALAPSPTPGTPRTPAGASPAASEPTPRAAASPAPTISSRPPITALVPRWRCVGAAPGRTTIELAYARPGERDVLPARIALFLVDVL